MLQAESAVASYRAHNSFLQPAFATPEKSWPAQPNRRPIIAAYFYPGWHCSPERSVRGDGSEWPLLYDAAARLAYPDIRRPLAGPVQTTAQSLQDDVRQASASGIDAFIWCWYWERGTRYFSEPLELFTRCSLPKNFRYALMWVNKRPHFHLPLATPSSALRDRARFVQTDEHDFQEMIRHLIDNHWRRRSYLKLAGRPLLPIFCPDQLARQLGRARFTQLLQNGQALARAAGFDGIHYLGIVHRLRKIPPMLHRLGFRQALADPPLKEIGFNSVSTYVYLPDWDGPTRQDYAELIEQRVTEWPQLARRFSLPFWPSISPGWDARPRGIPTQTPFDAYPWSPVVTGESPARFSRLLDHWRQFADQAGDVPILPVASWNEWSEGHAIAPCTRHGSAMLQALRAFTVSSTPPPDPSPAPARFAQLPQPAGGIR
jgi:hypothetical protein